MRNHTNSEHIDRLRTFTGVNCQKVRMFCSETESGVSKALFHPEIASSSILTLIRLGGILATVREGNSG